MSEYQQIDSKKYGLNKRTVVVDMGNNRYGIVKKRRSRIIMKDGHQIKDIADTIQAYDINAEVFLIHSGPVCSKTTTFLNENNIELLYE